VFHNIVLLRYLRIEMRICRWGFFTFPQEIPILCLNLKESLSTLLPQIKQIKLKLPSLRNFSYGQRIHPKTQRLIQQKLSYINHEVMTLNTKWCIWRPLCNCPAADFPSSYRHLELESLCDRFGKEFRLEVWGGARTKSLGWRCHLPRLGACASMLSAM